MEIQQVQKHLLKFSIKPSVQRIAIMEYLMENSTHPTIDEIYTALSPSIPTLSKTTVYNTLKLFGEQKAVLCLTIDDRNARFDGDISCHGHFKCKKCGLIHDVELKEKDLPQFNGGDNLDLEYTQVYFFGTCKTCQNSLN